MDRNSLLQPEFNAGEPFLPLMASEEAYINGMLDGLSYESLLSLSLGDVKPLSVSSFQPLLLNYIPHASAASTLQQDSEITDFANRGFPLTNTENLDIQKLKHAKVEPVNEFYRNNNGVFLPESFNFFDNTSEDFRFRLPDLRSLDQPNNYPDIQLGNSPLAEPVSVPKPHNTWYSNIRKPKRHGKSYASSSARVRRQTISEKTRCLEKLMPWDKKMDTATMLEEAYKYVKFLKAQISVLQSMPFHDEGVASSSSGSVDKNGNTSYESCVNEVKTSDVFGTLGRLNRQQLLQVFVNSPVAQNFLYSKGCCVYSVEQLMQLAQRNASCHQMLFFSGFLS